MEDWNRRPSRTYPELSRFSSKEEADKVTKAWRKQIMKKPMFWLAMVGYGCVVGATVAVVLTFLKRWLHVPPSMFGGIAGGVVGGSSLAVVTSIWRRRFRRFLREALVERGIPICLSCGYDLRGQIEPRCPECGTRFDARLIDSG